MKPYYEHNGITIYCGDCRDILPALPPIDLVLTDPPYGIRKWNSTGGNSLKKNEAADVEKWDSLPDPALLRSVAGAGKRSIIWGGNYLCGALGAFRSPLVWDKEIRGMHFADGELAWTNFDFGTLRIFRFGIAGGDTKGKRVHPTQKPLALMTWCITQSKTEGIILDPFMGSGTTLRAAKDMGRVAIGIEIEEKYCAIAADRLSQEVLF